MLTQSKDFLQKPNVPIFASTLQGKEHFLSIDLQEWVTVLDFVDD